MKTCKKCLKEFKNWIVIDSRPRNISNRKYCLECSPFGMNNTKKLESPSSPDISKKRKHSVNNVRKRRKKIKELAVNYLGGKCSICGYNKCLRALEFHHKEKIEKSYTIGRAAYRYSWDKIKIELDKCVLLCSNCHREQEELEHLSVIMAI